MSTLPFTKYKVNERTVSGTVDVENSDVLLNVDTSVVACVINLKSIPNDFWSTLYILYIKDLSGTCATNNITIIAPIGFKINNQQSIVLNVNSVCVTIKIASNTDYNTSYNTQTITSGHIIADEGTLLPQQPILNFIGELVTATDGTGETIVTINNNLLVKNTVYVMKNGSDSTGLVERLDKPFLTIEAATNAANTYFTNRDVDNRVKIIVESGNYTDIINLYTFIDYDLGNSIITAKAGNATISDFLGTFVIPNNGRYNNIIYGNASFVNNNFGTGGAIQSIWLTKGGKFYIEGISSYSLYGEAAFISGGTFVDFYIRTFKISNTNNNFLINAIQIYSFSGEQPNYVTINNAFISNVEISNQKSAICITGDVANVLNRLTLNNCQIQNYSTNSAAIQTFELAPIGEVNLTLINTILWNKTYADSISKVAAPCIINLWCYNSYANVGLATGVAAPTVIYGILNVDAAIIVNQGLPI